MVENLIESLSDVRSRMENMQMVLWLLRWPTSVVYSINFSFVSTSM